MAYSPLGLRPLAQDGTLKAIAGRLDATAAHVALAWASAERVVAIPKAAHSSTYARSRGALEISLAAKDLEELEKRFSAHPQDTPRDDLSARRRPMIVPFFEATSGVAIYINPAFVVSLRPDPSDPERISIVKLSDGETVHIRGGHDAIAERLSRTSAAA
jgi:hypothetical protein